MSRISTVGSKQLLISFDRLPRGKLSQFPYPFRIGVSCLLEILQMNFSRGRPSPENGDAHKQKHMKIVHISSRQIDYPALLGNKVFPHDINQSLDAIDSGIESACLRTMQSKYLTPFAFSHIPRVENDHGVLLRRPHLYFPTSLLCRRREADGSKTFSIENLPTGSTNLQVRLAVYTDE